MIKEIHLPDDFISFFMNKEKSIKNKDRLVRIGTDSKYIYNVKIITIKIVYLLST